MRRYIVPVTLLLWPMLAGAGDDFGLGDGHSGPLVLPVNSGPVVVNRYAQLVARADAGQNPARLQINSTMGFAAGDLVLVWQAVGLAAPAPGDQTAIDLEATPVGQFELARVAQVDPGELRLATPLTATFEGVVSQVVQVPEYTTVDVASGAAIVARAWNGASGGIVALLARGQVTLTGNGAISANEAGLRGGLVATGAGNRGCSGLDETFTNGKPNGGQRGEGLSPAGFGALSIGRGNLGSGGGGGVCLDSGGAGGGNGGQGGRGGRSAADDNGPARPVGGLGGSRLRFSAASRVALGGGAGAGDADNGIGTSGAVGGGVVLMRVQKLAGSGRVDARGGTPPLAANPGSDGAGGGGAGGTIHLRSNSAIACTAIDARGGDGGSLPGAQRGPGGGGGGGHLFVQAPAVACPLRVEAGTAGTQGDANAMDGQSYGAEPLAPDAPTSIGVLEQAASSFCGADADCAGPTRWCDRVGGRCVECLVDATCGGGKPVCDAKNRACRACAADPECGGATPACLPSGACGECSAKYLARCLGARPVCDLFTYRCRACLGDGECAQPTPACQPGGGCGECSLANGGRCQGDQPVCDVLAGLCRGCANDGDCVGEQPACQLTGACGECSAGNRSLCQGDQPVCNLAKGSCRGCVSDADCAGETPACQPGGGCGQCSMANHARCGGQTPICNLGRGACAACDKDADCPGKLPACLPSGECAECSKSNLAACQGVRPVCGLPAGVCRACMADADCGGNTPACQRSGACAQCSLANPSLCGGNTPACDPIKAICRACLVDTDCGGNTPACQFSGACGECSLANHILCNGTRPACDVVNAKCRGCQGDFECGLLLPVCQPSGACGECAKGNPGVCRPPTPLCDLVRGRCAACVPGEDASCANSRDGRVCLGNDEPQCGCRGDADCGADDSGRVCDGVQRRCVDGCSPAKGRNRCPLGRFCSSDDLTGVAVGVCTNSCNFDQDCAKSPATPLCRLGGDGGSGLCVGCRKDADCAAKERPVCVPVANRCEQCSPMNTAACNPNDSGGACLKNSTCGCVDDDDCGMDRRCDLGQGRCRPALADLGALDLAGGDAALLRDGAPLDRAPGDDDRPGDGAADLPLADAATGVDLVTGLGDRAAQVDMASGDGGPAAGSGCSCAVASRHDGPAIAWPQLFASFIIATALRRRRFHPHRNADGGDSCAKQS